VCKLGDKHENMSQFLILQNWEEKKINTQMLSHKYDAMSYSKEYACVGILTMCHAMTIAILSDLLSYFLI